MAIASQNANSCSSSCISRQRRSCHLNKRVCRLLSLRAPCERKLSDPAVRKWSVVKVQREHSYVYLRTRYANSVVSRSLQQSTSQSLPSRPWLAHCNRTETGVFFLVLAAANESKTTYRLYTCYSTTNAQALLRGDGSVTATILRTWQAFQR